MVLFAAAAIGWIALMITPGYLFYFDVTPKAVILMTAVAVLVWSKAAGRTGRVHRAVELLLLLYLISLGLSTALSANPALSAFGTSWRRFGAVSQAATVLFARLILQHTAGRPDRVRIILRGIAVAGSLASIYGVAQYFGWDPFLPPAAYHIGQGVWTIVRPPGTMGYVSYFASWLTGGSLLSLCLASMETDRRIRWLSFGAAALMAMAMVLTGTRGAALGWLAGVAVWALGKASAQRKLRLTPRMGIAAGLMVLAAVGFYFSPWGWNLRSRARWFIEDPWGGSRRSLWRDSFLMAAHRLPAGYGPETFTATFPHFESQTLARAYPDFLHESPHNMFLDALVSQGLPGLAILAAICVVAIRSARASPWLRAALVAQIVSQQFIVFTIPTAVLFFTTVALAAAVDRPAPVEPGRRTLGWALIAAPVCAALLFVTVRFTVADRYLAMAQRSVEAGDLATAASRYTAYDQWRLPGTAADLWFSRALIGLAQTKTNPVFRLQAVGESGRAALRAVQTAEDPFNAWYNMSGLYASQNDAKDTERSLRSAIAAHPNWFKPHWTLAQVLRLEGRVDEAESEAALAADLNGGKHAEVERTLAEIRAQRATISRPLP